jgi:hypothetical protein
MLYEGAARPIIERIIPPGEYAAGLIGYGSDVLGYDTERSADHNWGPRFQVFLEPGAPYADALDDAFRAGLPREVQGHPTSFSEPDPEDDGTQVPDRGAQGPVNHLIEITTLTAFLERYLGRDIRGDLSLLDWLVFPEERLLELTSGEVFHDPHGELASLRRTLAEYPRDVWIYKMACQWRRIAQLEAFAGRCAEVGDVIGMRLVAARLVRDIMKLCFLMERTYPPYDKWLGTAFGRLACGPSLSPHCRAALEAADYKGVEAGLTTLYRALGEMHNRLGVTGPVDPAPRFFFGRPYFVIRADRFANALLAAIKADEIKAIPIRIGSIDQFIDSPDYIENVALYGRTRRLFDAG